MRTAICTALIALLTPTLTVLAQPGSLDLNFDGDGIVMTPTVNGGSGNAVVVQPDGRIVVAALLPNYVTISYDIQVLRYMPDGSLDNTFGTAGSTITTASSQTYNHVGLALQSDGRILVSHDVGGDMAVLRYTSDGILDPTFGGDGVVTTSFSSGIDAATCVGVQADGKIVAAGYTTGATVDVAVARYNADGSLDDSFSYDGKLTTTVSAVDVDKAYALGFTADGSILVAGTVAGGGGDQAFVIKYMADGTLANGFGTNGVAEFAMDGYVQSNAYSMVIQPDGRIVVGGVASSSSFSGFAIARLTSNGTLDPTFGSGGAQVLNVPGGNYNYAPAVAMQADGKFVLGGQTGQIMAVARFAADGTVDFTFGTGGYVETPMAAANSTQGLTIQPDGKILLVGNTLTSPSSIILIRYLSGVNMGIEDPGPLSNVKLYPDPARDQINISFTEPISSQAVMTLVNSTGQAVPLSSLAMQRSTDRREYTIALSGMAPGPYVLRVVDGSAMRTLLFIKD